MGAAARAAFAAAVDAYRLDAVPLEPALLERARGALDASEGILLVGEAHGVEQTPAVLFSLLRGLGLRRLALEWAEDELRPVADGDPEALWELSPEAEAFSGDGRITAGHVALLRAVELDEVVLLDRVGTEGDERSLAMGERLLAVPRPVLAVLGAGHARLEEGTAAARVASEIRGLTPVSLAWAGGSCWFHGERALAGEPPRLAAELPLPPARPAVVPAP